MKKIGIMGGTFNPIHNGHLALAEAAMHHCGLHEVWFMPSGYSYFKDKAEIATGENRIHMTQLAIDGYPCFKCSDLEVKREGNTYTVDTLEQLNQMYPEDMFYFIMGADSLLALTKWKDPRRIAMLCTLVAVVRDDVNMQELEEGRKYLEKTLDARIILVPFRKIDISSSEIRRKLSEKEAVEDLLPSKVLAYIYENQLYDCEGTCTNGDGTA